jgi:ZIP family zinc transporter
MGYRSWAPALIGFPLGGAAIWGADRLLPHLHPFAPRDEAESLPTSWRRSLLLVLAIILHNVLEGLAVGVAFGAAAAGYENAYPAGAVALAFGVGLQNWPEGMAVSVPLRREGSSADRSFFYGQFSAAAESAAGVLGAGAVVVMRPLLPFALAFAAGAMIFVVVEEVVPESQAGGHADAATLGALVGFAVMMTLDVALGRPLRHQSLVGGAMKAETLLGGQGLGLEASHLAGRGGDGIPGAPADHGAQGGVDAESLRTSYQARRL